MIAVKSTLVAGDLAFVFCLLFLQSPGPKCHFIVCYLHFVSLLFAAQLHLRGMTFFFFFHFINNKVYASCRCAL